MQEIRRMHLSFCTVSFLIHQFTLNRLHFLPQQNSQQIFLEILNFSLRCCCVRFLDSSLVKLLNDLLTADSNSSKCSRFLVTFQLC